MVLSSSPVLNSQRGHTPSAQAASSCSFVSRWCDEPPSVRAKERRPRVFERETGSRWRRFSARTADSCKLVKRSSGQPGASQTATKGCTARGRGRSPACFEGSPNYPNYQTDASRASSLIRAGRFANEIAIANWEFVRTSKHSDPPDTSR